jgi:hypothetical protein
MMVIGGAVALFIGLSVDREQHWWGPLAILFGAIFMIVGALSY